MEAGRLRHRVTIEEKVESRDAYGGERETWVEYAEVWAEKSPLVGREYLEARQMMAEVTTKAEDMLTLPDGRLISPSVLTHPFKPLDSIEGSQIVQTAPDRVTVRLVPGAGYRQAGIELVSFTLEAVGSVAKPAITRASVAASADPGHALKGQRRVFFPEVKDFVTASIFDYQRLLPGNEVRGPSIIETPVTTIVVPPGGRAEVDPYLTVKMTLG